ncbi:hypothetical protein Tco_0871171 [Tanacetum coccineum]
MASQSASDSATTGVGSKCYGYFVGGLLPNISIAALNPCFNVSGVDYLIENISRDLEFEDDGFATRSLDWFHESFQGSGRSKKIEKTIISKRKADEEAAAKAAAEEQDAIRKSNEKTTKKKIKEAKKEARKKLAKKKQLERDTEENVSDNEEYDYQSVDVDNKEKTDEEAAKRKAELLAELQAIETRLEKKAKDEAQNEDNDVNVNENADEADNEEDENNEEDAANNEEDDNEEDDDNEENVDQVFHKIKTLPFLNAATRSNKIEDGKESPKRFTRGDAKRQAEFKNVNPQNEAEDDEEVKSISSDDEIVETKKKGRKSKGKKEGKR